ncbi:MAG TPA: TVP38/TMEM64 family protein [Syntrophobacteraceae bacterium]|nr:TVP38/TMEM64 family protein [Syntrophobacteraceae bacterium]
MKIGRESVPLKLLILLAMAGILIALAEFSPIKAYLSPDRFQRIIAEAGLIGPALLLVLCAVGTCFFIPGTVFVGVGAAMFGPFLGFACVWPGTIAGAVLSWFAARRLGRKFVCSLIGNRLMKFDDLLERNGFKAVLLLRLMFVPLVLINYGVGLTKVRFRDYFFATALGEAATIFAVTFFIGEIREIWISQDPGRLLSTRMALSLGTLIALASVAKLIRKRYRKYDWQ